MYISKKHRDWLLPDPEQNWLQISADLIHLRRQNEEDIARKVSGEDTSWLECEDELKQMSPEELDKRSNRFKRYQQKRIQKAKTDILKKKEELKQLIDKYEHILNTKLDLPLIVEELLGTPFRYEQLPIPNVLCDTHTKHKQKDTITQQEDTKSRALLSLYTYKPKSR